MTLNDPWRLYLRLHSLKPEDAQKWVYSHRGVAVAIYGSKR